MTIPIDRVVGVVIVIRRTKRMSAEFKGTKDQLLIDKMIIRNCKRKLTGLGMAWIDFRKAFDMMPHSWLLKCLELFGAANNLSALVKNSMNGWKTELMAGGEMSGEVKINTGIFQRDSLSPLLFALAFILLTLTLRKMKAGYNLDEGKRTLNYLLYIDHLKLYGKNESHIESLVQFVRIFSADICMEFGISKCATLIMKRGKVVCTEGVELPVKEKIRSLSEDSEGYRYLGIIDADDINHSQMKELVQKEYFRRVFTKGEKDPEVKAERWKYDFSYQL